MKNIAAIILFSILVNIESSGQSAYMNTRDKFFIGYEVAIPSGFLTTTSWVGARFDYRRMINRNFSVGIASSWNSFSEYVPQTTYQKQDGTGAVTADMVKTLYEVPITASAHYYFSAGKSIVPYVGLGLGTQYSDQTVYMNIYSLTEYNWGFVVRPEVGIIYPFNDNVGAYFSAAYNYATNENDDFDVSHLQHVALTLGITFSSK